MNDDDDDGNENEATLHNTVHYYWGADLNKYQQVRFDIEFTICPSLKAWKATAWKASLMTIDSTAQLARTFHRVGYACQLPSWVKRPSRTDRVQVVRCSLTTTLYNFESISTHRVSMTETRCRPNGSVGRPTAHSPGPDRRRPTGQAPGGRPAGSVTDDDRQQTILAD